MNNEMEMIIFNIINYAGTAKGLAYEALNEAEKGTYDKIPEMMK